MLWRMGVELQCDTRLGVDVQLEELTAAYDAVFLALGAFNANAMNVPDEDADGVVTAVDFLGELELNGSVPVGKNVAVIGGGFTAMDACRTAVRLGAAEVTCLYRRSRKEMPAHHTEVDEAEEEGVRLELLVAPVRVVTDGDVVSRHRVRAHGARRAGRLRPPPPRARRGLRVRGRVRPGHHRHRPVPQPRRHERGAGRQAHAVAHASR